ncbi:MAG: COX15/CtaA family protein, partial [Dongiaceae bacterium]
PLMGGRLVPADALRLEPAWINLFENPATAQFAHRVLAVALAALTAWLWLGGRAAPLPGPARAAVNLFSVMVFAQAGLGIATLLLAVPIPLAAAHQAGAVILVTLALWALHCLRGAGRGA